MRDDGKLERILKLYDEVLRRGSLTTRRAQRVLDIDDAQTARRDLKSLVRAGVIEERGKGSAHAYILCESYRDRRGVTAIEAVALHLGRQVLGFVTGTDLSLDAVEEKITFIPDHDATRETLERRVVFWSEPYRDYRNHDNTLDEILTALLRTHELDLQYASRKGVCRYPRVRPLALVVYRRALYLLLHHAPDTRVRRLAVDRILEARWTHTPFVYPPRFRVEQELEHTFGIFDDPDHPPAQVRLLFDADAAYLVHERVWHPKATVTTQPDGSVLLEMFVNGRELVRLALEWGPKVEVLEPEWLRTAVVDSLRAALSRYPSSE